MRPVNATLSGTSTVRNHASASIVRWASNVFGSMVATWSPARRRRRSSAPAHARARRSQLGVGECGAVDVFERDRGRGDGGPPRHRVRRQAGGVEHRRMLYTNRWTSTRATSNASIVDVFGALADRIAPLDRLREHEPGGFSPELWEQLVAMGAPGMGVPEAAGGAGAAMLDLALAVEALGRRLAPAPLVEHAVAARVLAVTSDDVPAAVVDGAAIATVRPQAGARWRCPPSTRRRGRRARRRARRRGAGARHVGTRCADREPRVLTPRRPRPRRRRPARPRHRRRRPRRVRARGRRMAGADRGGAGRARARCAHHRGALRDRARAVRGAHRLLPEPPARARRRRRRSRRGPAARP